MTVESARGNLSFTRTACIECGLCIDACDLLEGAGLTIGEVASRALAGETSGDAVDAIFRCSLCGLCCAECPEGIDSRVTMMSARELLGAENALPETYFGMFDGYDFGIFMQYKQLHGISYEDLDKDGQDTVFFPGCALSTYAPEIVRSVHAWLAEQGIDAGVIDICCGAGLSAGGMTESADVLHKRIADELEQRNTKRLIVACPECFGELDGMFDSVEVVRLSSLMHQAGVQVSGGSRLTVHDSCSDRSGGVIGDDLRAMLANNDLVEMEHSGERTICCGSGGLVSCVDPDLSEARATRRIAEFNDTGADHVITACLNCSNRLGAVAQPGDVVHYLELVFNVRIDWADVNNKLAALFDSGTLHTIQNAAVLDGVEASGVEVASV